ncbi:FAST kinase domain-containing protein 4-like [Babylonia areolata]|uniref:FAST kinase domain-containing protein 4-like n=1 Tax=Babylonia areolata TaxID=304850 RepID=UPI003FD6B250
MIPCQAGTPLRWMLRPCLRFSLQYSASRSNACGVKCEMQMASPAPSMHLSVSPCAGSAVVSSRPGPESFCSHRSRPFFTSSSISDAAQHEVEDAAIKALKFKNGEKVQAILSASFEELMTMAEKADSAFMACVMLQRLSALHKEGRTMGVEGDAVLKDSRLSGVSRVIDEGITRLSPRAILTTLQGLYEMTPTDVYIIKSLATQVVWLMRRMPVPLLIQALQLHLHHQGESSLRQSMVQQSLSALERRWVELTHPKDIIFLMYVTQGAPLSQVLVERLEDRALDVVEKASPKELYRVIYLLSRQGHRNTPLIRALVYHLNKTSLSSLSAVQLTNLVYALCTLSVFDAALLSKVCAELHAKQADLTAKLVSSLLTSFSRLRWKDGGMLNMLVNVLEGKAVSATPPSSGSHGVEGGAVSVQSDVDSLEASDKAGVVLSLANLNMDSAQCRELVGRVVGSEGVQGLRQSSPLLWVDVVWSLAVLRLADAASVASVLSEDFLGKLPSSDGFQSILTMSKVNNINTAASCEVEGYTGPLLPPSLPSPDPKLLQKGERSVTEKLIAALTNMAPADTYTLVNTTGPGGYLIDAEFYVDSEGNPKPLSQVSENAAQYHRVALKVLEFPDLTFPTSDLTGLHAMAVRHLRCHGYTVVQVLHSEIPSKSKVVEQVNFLQQKVKDAVKPRPDAGAPADS